MSKLENYVKAIASFAEGRPIEVRSYNTGLWIAIPHEAYDEKRPPTFGVWEDFRIAKFTLKYCVAHMREAGVDYLSTVYNDVDYAATMSLSAFVEWVTDWEYVDSSL